jgi:predicted AAA+ superfamily ATPase
LVQQLLRDSDVPRDSLPYTDAFDALKRKYEAARKESIDDHAFWLLVHKIGKFGGLATSGPRKKGSKAPKLTDSEQMEVLRLMPDGIGTRDHLPYTARFNDMHQRFRRSTGRKLTEHEFWRAVLLVAKNARKPKPVHDAAPVGSLTPELVAFLEDNNPWWRGKPMKQFPTFQRWAFGEVVSRLQSRMAPIVAVRGSRRVGKSVLQAQLIEELLLAGKTDPTRTSVESARILSVQFDDAPALGGVSMPIQAIVRWYEDHILGKTLNEAAREGRPAYLLFDEVQNLADWSVQLKILADKADARILVTGSSALRIAKGQDNLAGRVTTIELGPLRLWEVAAIRGIRGLLAYAPDAPLEEWKEREFWLGLVDHGRKHASARDRAFRLLSERGGYPLCHVATDQSTDTVRQQIVGEVIDKTIQHDPGHKRGSSPLDPAFVREVFRMVCRYAGQVVMPKRFAEELQQLLQAPISNAKVTEAIQFLADSLLVYCVPPLEMLQKKQPHPSKLCICDHFVRSGVLQETLPLDPESLKTCDEAVSTQVGHVIESVLGYFLKGIPGLEVGWFPKRHTEPEVDLILTVGTNRIPLEVKYRRGAPDKTALAGIESFCSKPAYAAPFGILVTQTAEGPIGKDTIAVPASTFLLLK